MHLFTGNILVKYIVTCVPFSNVSLLYIFASVFLAIKPDAEHAGQYYCETREERLTQLNLSLLF